MQVGDLARTTEGRHILNTKLLPRIARELKEGARVLFIGLDMAWDYKSLFFNPSCLCDFVTMDIAEKFNPDIVGDISNCPQVEDNSVDFLPLIGIYEFVNDKPAMFKEINRILKPDGLALLALPGPGAYDSPQNHITPTRVYEEIKPLRIEEMHVVGERDGRPITSILILARKA